MRSINQTFVTSDVIVFCFTPFPLIGRAEKARILNCSRGLDICGKFYLWITKSSSNRVFSHDVTAAILVSQNNETAALTCWRPELILWELNSFLMQTLSFVPINLHRCWLREWKRPIRGSIKCQMQTIYIRWQYRRHFRPLLLRRFRSFHRFLYIQNVR